MRGKEFWKKHLPQGSTVRFQVGLQGAVIVSQLLAGKQQIGYIVDDEAQEHIKSSWGFLIARKVLTASGATFPVQVQHLPKSDFKG